MLTADTLPSESRIRHMFFTRQGGVSGGIYASLNCGPGSGDTRAHVLDNRARAMAVLGLEPEALVTLHQVHSPDCVGVEVPWDIGAAPRADAMVTTVPGIALGVLTADCAPVLLCDAEAGVIGAAHAGWKGALGGVIDATVQKMLAEGARPDRLHAVIGPCIGAASYEVGAEFRAAFMEAGAGNVRFFRDGAAAGKFQFDLGGYVMSRLVESGVDNAQDMKLDTYADDARFFSYRRATHRGERDYGRLLSAIAILPED